MELAQGMMLGDNALKGIVSSHDPLAASGVGGPHSDKSSLFRPGTGFIANRPGNV